MLIPRSITSYLRVTADAACRSVKPCCVSSTASTSISRFTVCVAFLDFASNSLAVAGISMLSEDDERPDADDEENDSDDEEGVDDAIE
mmetsp:Transcript_30135/g.52715  ORF Transcript_30135/g.52715 Transcript_30135/m.52715 type:complete len:88 (-) Transcript_30135:208-471(-)